MIPTREILWNIGSISRVILLASMVLPFIFIAFGLARRVSVWRRGKPEDRFGQWGIRLRGALVKSIFHGRIIRRNKRYAGIMHACIFGGFVILFIGTVIVAIEDDITVPLFHWSFYRGNFYLGYKLMVNIGGGSLIVGGVIGILRRLRLPPQEQATGADDQLLLPKSPGLSTPAAILHAHRPAPAPPRAGGGAA